MLELLDIFAYVGYSENVSLHCIHFVIWLLYSLARIQWLFGNYAEKQLSCVKITLNHSSPRFSATRLLACSIDHILMHNIP